VIGTPLLLEPEIAIAVTVEVPDGVPVAAGPPPELTAGGVDESLLLQLSIPIRARATKQPEARLHRRPSDPRRRTRRPTGIRTNGVSREASIVGDACGDSSATGPPSVLSVSTVFTGPPFGVTVAGLKLQVAPTGKLPQLKLTGCVNPVEKAAKLYQQCADMGNDGCQLAMGQLNEFGEGVPKNEKQAASWYRKSADQGNAIGQKTLGLLYELGKGVPENWTEAARLYAKGAHKFQDSAFALGRMYEFGMAVPQNRAVAIQWFKKAANMGHPKGAYWARWLNDYSNCIGFRDQQEQNAIRGLRCPADPVGVVFRNSRERAAYIEQKAKEFDAIEAQAAAAQAARVGAQNNFECNSAGGSWTADRQATFGGHCN